MEKSTFSIRPSCISDIIRRSFLYGKVTWRNGVRLLHKIWYVRSVMKLTNPNSSGFYCGCRRVDTSLTRTTCINNFFLKNNSYVSQGLQKLVKFWVDNKRLIRIRIHVDSKFIEKFIFTVDERIYLWLQQCSICSAVTDTDLCLVDFTPLIQDIQYNRFN